MKDIIKLGYIGCGRRGRGMLKANFSKMKDVVIKTICDASQARMDRAQEHIMAGGGYTVQMTTDYHDILNDPEIDAVVIMTGWSGRPQLAIECMEAGKPVAIEVGCADTLEECFALVDTYERTGVPLMMLENCCYGRRELMMLRMVKEGLFGEVVHCAGGYFHYLNECDLFKGIDTDDIPHYRLAHYINENRESYPTHELGPIAKVLNINRGNRMVRLCSIASKARGLKAYAAKTFGADSKWANIDYKQGDIVTTLITCAGGETISLTLDTTVPRAFYSRGFSVRGTLGMSDEDTKTVFLEGMEEGSKNKGNEPEFFEKYDHPLQREYQTASRDVGGHADGIDWLVSRAFVESVKNGTLPPIDVYDAASWMCIGVLSAQSIRENGAPVEIPDFTRGKWQSREPATKDKYCLAEVCEDPDTPIFPA